MSFIQRDPERMGGKPCLTGHRVTVEQVLAELADRSGPGDLADEMGWNEDDIRGLLREIALAYRT